MQKIIFEAPGKPALVDAPLPECPPDGVLLKTIYSGISNGTERNMMMGGNYNPSKIFPLRTVGYQATSVVVECGREVQRFREGDFVATGTFGVHAQYHVARDNALICKLPQGFDHKSGAFLSVAAVAWHDAMRASVGPADTVLVCGAGPIGQFSVQACKLLGAQVTLLNRSAGRAEVGRTLGADRLIVGDENAIEEGLKKHAPFTVVVETTSSQHLINQLIGDSVGGGVFARRGRGRFLMIGGAWDVTYSSNAAQRAELAILHAQHYDLGDLEAVIGHVYEGRIRMNPIIRDIIPFRNAVSFYETLRDHPSHLFGTIIDWNGSP